MHMAFLENYFEVKRILIRTHGTQRKFEVTFFGNYRFCVGLKKAISLNAFELVFKPFMYFRSCI